MKLTPYQYAQRAQRRLLQQRQRPHAPAPLKQPYRPHPNPRAHNTRQIGTYYEQLAAQFLSTQGYDMLARQLHYPYGEIDLLAFSDPYLVAVEVRYRRQTRYGGAHYSLSPAKIRRLRRAAARAYQEYTTLLTKTGDGDLFLRIDVILFDAHHLHWLPQAVTYE